MGTGREVFFLEGILPLRVSEKMADVEALDAVDFRANHPSFMGTWDDDLEPPSLEIIRMYLSKGFGERLTSGEAAARKLNHKCFYEAKSNIVSFRSSSGKR